EGLGAHNHSHHLVLLGSHVEIRRLVNLHLITVVVGCLRSDNVNGDWAHIFRIVVHYRNFRCLQMEPSLSPG
ncbi:hypothetical protein PMAYCL1PPCAC_16024, partial [Pristionchus mayeri]